MTTKTAHWTKRNSYIVNGKNRGHIRKESGKFEAYADAPSGYMHHDSFDTQQDAMTYVEDCCSGRHYTPSPAPLRHPKAKVPAKPRVAAKPTAGGVRSKPRRRKAAFKFPKAPKLEFPHFKVGGAT